MNSLKDWLLEIMIKKGGPSAVRGAIGMGVAALLAHQGMLEKFGVFYDAVNHIITVHLTALTDALDLTLIASVAGIVKIVNHHADEAVKTVLPSTTPPAI